MAEDIYASVTARIIEKLEQGVTPWVRPWDRDKCAGPDSPVNAVTVVCGRSRSSGVRRKAFAASFG